METQQLRFDSEITNFVVPTAPIACEDLIDTDVCWQVEDWCRRYGKYADQDFFTRYAIGVYQVHQYWNAINSDKEQAYTAAAACCIHVMAAAGAVGCQLYVLGRFSDVRCEYSSAKLLSAITAAQQQFCYIKTCKPGSARYKRISKPKLSSHIATIVQQMIGLVPANKRAIAIREELNRLNNFEWKR